MRSTADFAALEQQLLRSDSDVGPCCWSDADAQFKLDAEATVTAIDAALAANPFAAPPLIVVGGDTGKSTVVSRLLGVPLPPLPPASCPLRFQLRPPKGDDNRSDEENAGCVVSLFETVRSPGAELTEHCVVNIEGLAGVLEDVIAAADDATRDPEIRIRLRGWAGCPTLDVLELPAATILTAPSSTFHTNNVNGNSTATTDGRLTGIVAVIIVCRATTAPASCPPVCRLARMAKLANIPTIGVLTFTDTLHPQDLDETRAEVVLRALQQPNLVDPTSEITSSSQLQGGGWFGLASVPSSRALLSVPTRLHARFIALRYEKAESMLWHELTRMDEEGRSLGGLQEIQHRLGRAALQHAVSAVVSERVREAWLPSLRQQQQNARAAGRLITGGADGCAFGEAPPPTEPGRVDGELDRSGYDMIPSSAAMAPRTPPRDHYPTGNVPPSGSPPAASDHGVITSPTMCAVM